ncbi:hypothetical protein HKX48_007162 [Thoreauomyces humboldtii]|nr:hypothetical protein HKX48_007162 [Thoreauomyces humboldtii]
MARTTCSSAKESPHTLVFSNQKMLLLPIELILRIVELLMPSGDYARQSPPYLSPVALSSSHPVTETLLALTRVCRAVNPVATRLLYSKCLYIDSYTRLADLVDTLDAKATAPHTQQTNPWGAATLSVEDHLTCLFLAPFPFENLNDLAASLNVQRLFAHLHNALERLVIDMPLRTLYPDDDQLGVRRPLFDAFTSLKKVQEFVSVRDELFLAYDAFPSEVREVWASWPRLKRLALYNVDIGRDKFWAEINALPVLETLVLSRADGIEERETFSSDRALRIVFVDGEDPRLPTDAWVKDAEKAGTILRVIGPLAFDLEEDVAGLCQEWIKDHAVAGDLWDHERQTPLAV